MDGQSLEILLSRQEVSPAQLIWPRPGRKALRGPHAPYAKDSQPLKLRAGIQRGLGGKAGRRHCPESIPWASGPPVEADALSVRTGSLYQAGPTGPQLRALLGACPQQASLLPNCPGGTEETAEAQAQPLPARGSLQVVPALCRLSQPVRDSMAPYRRQQAETRTAILEPRGQCGLCRARAICQQPREKAAAVTST